jgi:hypothetical protein
MQMNAIDFNPKKQWNNHNPKHELVDNYVNVKQWWHQPRKQKLIISQKKSHTKQTFTHQQHDQNH